MVRALGGHSGFPALGHIEDIQNIYKYIQDIYKIPGGGQAAAARPGPEAPGPARARASGPGRAAAAWRPPGILYISCIYCIYFVYISHIFRVFSKPLLNRLSIPHNFLNAYPAHANLTLPLMKKFLLDYARKLKGASDEL